MILSPAEYAHVRRLQDAGDPSWLDVLMRYVRGRRR